MLHIVGSHVFWRSLEEHALFNMNINFKFYKMELLTILLAADISGYGIAAILAV